MIIKDENMQGFIKLSEIAKTSRMLIFITQEEKDALKRFSNVTGLSMTEVIRRSIYSTLKELEVYSGVRIYP